MGGADMADALMGRVCAGGIAVYFGAAGRCSSVCVNDAGLVPRRNDSLYAGARNGRAFGGDWYLGR